MNQENCGLILESLEQAGLTGKKTDWPEFIDSFSDADVGRELAAAPRFSLRRLAVFLSSAANGRLEDMAAAARALTLRRFGRVVTLFAPLYVSNFCLNRCKYCGFHSSQSRRRLSVDEAMSEAAVIADEGFRDILLVSGEDPHFISVEYLAELATRLRTGRLFSSVSAEIAALDFTAYQRLADAGVEGITMFQETYDRNVFAEWHDGPKADYGKRLLAQEAAAAAGMRRSGLGVLLGLNDWRFETLAMAVHADTLTKAYWRSRVSFSFPRIRPANDVDAQRFQHLVNDRDLVRMMVALRLCFPDAGMTLSTRETAELRNHLIPLCITNVSAGSKTSPGGYAETIPSATEQFEVADIRGPAEVAEWLARANYEPVWKDWDVAFHSA